MEVFDPGQFLDKLQNPLEVKKLENGELNQLAAEVRQRIIDTVSKNGGHLAPSLGVVELTLALLKEFDLNRDKVIWDVGHQAYAHKLLTGRAPVFHTLRAMGGISGFPRPEESKYDHFGVGHSSTSISAALGMALARDLAGDNYHVVAVIGDGSLTGGQAFEGLNLAGHMGKRLIVILNDNEMSISPNVGALSLFLSQALSRRWLRQTRREALKFLRGIPRIGHKLALYAMRGEWSFKSFFTPGMLFEALRFNYIGPVDGHDLGALRGSLATAAAIEDGPVLLHVRTIKGKGYPPAESNPTLYHSIGQFSLDNGQPAANSPPTFTKIFASGLVDIAAKDRRVIAITAAMPEGTGTDLFRSRFPDRFIDTGICEQHAVTFAAGLAKQGHKPFLAIYSTFLQRGYDQIVHDVCLPRLPVTFCIDRAGLVGQDGATHHGVFDIAYLRSIPNMKIMAPRNGQVLLDCLETALHMEGPCAIRYPRGVAPDFEPGHKATPLSEGSGEIIQMGEKIAIIACGSSVEEARLASSQFEQRCAYKPLIFDPVWLKPAPWRQLEELIPNFKYLLFIEEGSLAGGFSSSILELINDNGLARDLEIRRLGIKDEFIQHGSQQKLREFAQVDAAAILRELLVLAEAAQKRNYNN